MGLRRGTLIWVHSSARAPTPTLPANGEGAESGAPNDRGEGDNLPPFAGGLRGGLIAIEALKVGDAVISNDGKPHNILRILQKSYRGWIVKLNTDASHSTLHLTPQHRVLTRPRPRTLGGQSDWSGSPAHHLAMRRDLRREASKAEQKLWSILRGKSTGFKFRRQHSLGPYIADFYSRDAHLVVELDGDHHYTPEGREHDRRRDAYLRNLGLEVLRIPVCEIDDNLEGVWLGIQRQCRMRTESLEGARWLQAASLQLGDVVFTPSPHPEGTRGRAGVGAGTTIAASTLPSPPLDPPANGGKEFGGPSRLFNVFTSATVKHLDFEWSEEVFYELQIDEGRSFVTEVCIVHND